MKTVNLWSDTNARGLPVLCLRAPYEYRDACKRVGLLAIPGRPVWKSDHDTQERLFSHWEYDADPDIAQDLIDIWADKPVDLQIDARVRQLADTRELDLNPSEMSYEKPAPKSKYPPRPYQLIGYRHAVSHSAVMIPWPMGYGKTWLPITMISNLNLHFSLIMCPKSVVYVWVREAEKHSTLPVYTLPLAKGSVRDRSRKLETAIISSRAMIERGLNDDPLARLLVIVNYDAARSGDMATALQAVRWSMIVCDESHMIKSPSSKISLFAARLAKRAHRRICMTGTPMPNSPLDIYGQYRFLDKRIYGGSFVRMRAAYAVMGGYGGHEILCFRNLPDLRRRYRRLAMPIPKGMEISLPPITHEQRDVELGPKAKRIYDQLRREFVADVQGGVVTASNALVRLVRMQQITSGYVPVESDDPEIEPQLVSVDNAKYNAMIETLEAIGDAPVVVFVRFWHDLDRVRDACAKLNRTYGELSGRRDDVHGYWRHDTDHDTIGVQVKAGGLGVDLTRARYAIFYSLNFTPGEFDQCVARLHRHGQGEHVCIYHLIASHTVDARIYDALRRKTDVIQAVLQDAREADNSASKRWPS